MKFVNLSLLLLVSLVFADASDLGAPHTSGSSSYQGGTDFVVYSQPYVFTDLANGIRHYTGVEGWACDDFILSSDAEIEGVQFYIVYAGYAPTSYELVFAEDAGDSDPNNYTTVWSATVPCTLVDTGDDNWGFTIYEVNCDIPSAFPSITAGPRYWLALRFHHQGVLDYVLVTETITGSMAWSGGTQTSYVNTLTKFGTQYDIFFNIFETVMSLESQTWGSIKSSF